MLKSRDELLLDFENLKHEQRQILASLDVVNLFTNVPVQETTDIIDDNT